MSQNSSFTKLSELPPETRLQIWECAYNNTPRRTIEVTFLDYSIYNGMISIIADPLPHLLEINGESRALLKSRFLNPFSSAWLEPTINGSSRSFSDLLIDLSKDTLRILNEGEEHNQWEERERREGRAALEFPMVYLFRHLFDGENSEMVLNNLVTLEIRCDLDEFFVSNQALNTHRFGVQHDIGIIKTYLLNLKVLIIQCDCHCDGPAHGPPCNCIKGVVCDSLVLDK